MQVEVGKSYCSFDGASGEKRIPLAIDDATITYTSYQSCLPGIMPRADFEAWAAAECVQLWGRWARVEDIVS